jgi:hypothetical protein
MTVRIAQLSSKYQHGIFIGSGSGPAGTSRTCCYAHV